MTTSEDIRNAGRCRQEAAARDPRARMAEPPGAIAVIEEGGEQVIRLSGEIDSLAVATYEHDSSALPDGYRPPAVIDASEVTFLDCRGLRFLLRTTRAARTAGRQPVLRRPARAVRRVVDVAGAGHLFTMTL